MKIKIVLILSIFLYPQLTTQDDVDIKNKVICNIAGAVWPSTYEFNINNLPKRCNIFSVGKYDFDRNDGIDTHVMEGDKNIFRALLNANKPAYTCIGFQYIDNWKAVFDQLDKNVFETEIFCPLINFLNEFKIGGLIFYFQDMYTTGVDDLATKISHFANALKKKVDKLVVGMIIEGNSHTSFTNNTLFDFSITNKALDIYIVKWSRLNSCNCATVKTGLSPIISTDDTIVTLKQIAVSLTNSCIDKSKIYAMIEMAPRIPLSLLPDDAMYSFSTYSIYCSITDQSNSSQWCTSPSKLIFYQGRYAKIFYAGIVLDQLDTDDYECNCNCGQYPVANIALDGWTGDSFKDCPALNKN